MRASGRDTSPIEPEQPSEAPERRRLLIVRRSRVAKRDRFVREAFARDPLGVRAVQRGAMPASRAFFIRKAMLAFAMMKASFEAGSR